MRAADRARIAREQGHEREAAYWQSIADLVAAAPPLSVEQQTYLRVLLRPAPSPEPRRSAA